jgi:hypothetical protein
MTVSLDIESSYVQYIFFDRKSGGDLTVKESILEGWQHWNFRHETEWHTDLSDNPVPNSLEPNVVDEVGILSIRKKPRVQLVRSEPEFDRFSLLQGCSERTPFEASRVLFSQRGNRPE